MNSVTASSVSLVYTIPVEQAAFSAADNFHAEVHSVSANTRTIINAPTVVPAGEAPGSATFSSIPLPVDGPYIITVYYSSVADQDATGTAPVLTQLGRAILNKVTPVISITI